MDEIQKTLELLLAEKTKIKKADSVISAALKEKAAAVASANELMKTLLSQLEAASSQGESEVKA